MTTSSGCVRHSPSSLTACCDVLSMVLRLPLSLMALLATASLTLSQNASTSQDSAPARPPSSSSAPAASSAPQVATLSAPSGYVLSANDQVAVEVFGEDDLRTNGRLNG